MMLVLVVREFVREECAKNLSRHLDLVWQPRLLHQGQPPNGPTLGMTACPALPFVNEHGQTW